MTGVLWGLLGALLIGGSDCIARVTARRVSSSILFLAIMGLSLTVLSLWLSSANNWPPWQPQAWAASALSGILNLVALYFLYLALARGPVAVASPAASTFTVILVALNAFSGEAWSGVQLVAVMVVFAGVVMLAQRSENGVDDGFDARWLRVTAAYGLAAAVAVSLRMFLAQEASAMLGALHALYLNRLFALLAAVVLLLWLLYRHSQLSWPSGQTTWLVVLQAVLETGALAAFLIGSADGGRVAATIGFSAFAAATALFAWVFLGEAIGWRRGFWMSVIAAGLVLAVAGSPRS